MYYLNLPLKIWQYVLIVVIILNIVIGIMVFRNKKLSPYIRFVSLWLTLLLTLNFINMYTTIKNYIEYSQVVGPKGPDGDNGARGFRGDSFVCNQCGDAGKEKEDIYGSNVNDDDQVIQDDPKLKIGKCIFPFVHNNEFKYDCTTLPREPNSINDSSIFGWCATSTNNDLTYNTFGYCKNSDMEKKRAESSKTRASNLQNYQITNKGILDIDIVSGDNSNVKCPSGFERINVDLNENASGKYIYMCVKKGLGDFGIGDVKINVDSNTCPSGYKLIDVDLNEESGGSVVKLCKQTKSSNFIKDIKIHNNTTSIPDNYDKLPTNLNEGAGGTPLYISLNKTELDLTQTIDTAFIYGKDESIYFFRDSLFWKYDNKKEKMSKGFPLNIKEKWGKLPDKLDAAMTYPYDNETYFFKGQLFWKYDPKKSKIASGYPKFIKSHWKGIPNNIDAIYIKNRKVYFIQKDLYFLYDDKNKKVKSGYPKKITNKFPGANPFPSAVFYDPYTEQTYYIESNNVKIYKNNSEIEDSPKSLGDTFLGII